MEFGKRTKATFFILLNIPQLYLLIQPPHQDHMHQLQIIDRIYHFNTKVLLLSQFSTI